MDVVGVAGGVGMFTSGLGRFAVADELDIETLGLIVGGLLGTPVSDGSMA